MAYVNVAEWKTNQVCEWLKGLHSDVLPYVHSFMNHNVNGQQLLNLRPEDLEHLGVCKLGHQELILEAVEYLRTFHYDLDRENLQLLAMRLSGQAHSLYNELARVSDLTKPVATQTLSDVVGIITAVKPLIRWLDRPPFSGHLEYNDKKAELLKLSLEMATCAQRDRFAERPMEEIKATCGQLAKLADYIIQDIADPMILQPASLDLATLKKKPGDDLGFCILPSFHGAHQVAEIKFGSAAHQCGKMEEGDEIVQVNYQTVVGWERKNVLELFRESPADLLLTLKRRPRHTKVYGQIYIKPYRLPSNKKTPYSTRWENNLPSPRPELLTIPDFVMPLPKHAKKTAAPKPASDPHTVSMLDTMTTDDSGSNGSTSSAGDDESDEDEDDGSECGSRSAIRLYSAKPRNLVQRRATITGASPTAKHSRVNIEQFWRELKREHSTLSFQLRDKAVSCAQGLNGVAASNASGEAGIAGASSSSSSPPQQAARPQTCLGIEQRRASASSSATRKVKFQDSGGQPLEQTSPPAARDDPHNDSQPQTSNQGTSASTQSNSEKSNNDGNENKEEAPKVPARVSPCGNKERGRLDKSFSTPAYDPTESDDDFIERKFEAALDEHHKQQLRARAAAGKSDCSNKTDSRLFDSVEDLEEHGGTMTSPPKPSLDDSDFVKNTIIGNVARKISDFEKNLHSRSNEHLSEKNSSKSSSLASPAKSSVHIKINDVDVSDHMEELEADSGNITTDFDSDDESNFFSSDTYDTKPEAKQQGKKLAEDRADTSTESTSRDGSEDKSEANTSSGSSSSNTDSDLKKQPQPQHQLRGDIVETIDGALIEKARQIESVGSEEEEEDEEVMVEQRTHQNMRPSPRGQRDGMIEALSPNIQVHRNALVGNISAKYPTSPSPSPSPTRPETPRREAALAKPEVKPRVTPPEPPPRKYFTKPAPLNINVNVNPQPVNHSPRDQHQQQQQHHVQHQQDRPRVPERPSVRRDLKRSESGAPEVHPRNEYPPEVYPRVILENPAVEHHRRRNESYADERSTDFIDELGGDAPHQHDISGGSSSSGKAFGSLVDPYGYTEIPEEPEPSPKSFVGSTSGAHEQHVRHDYGLQNADAADGLCHSRQNSQPAEGKGARSLEKDKSHERGVVNRAIMVARSMGLHGNSAKSSNSPRSVRKRTTNMAKRRNVAVKDVSPGDLEGWLIYRSRGAGGAWNRAWFVLKGASLYRFKAQDSTKAECLIALSGFTASQASEVKSRKYAFKVYYTGTVFYFAADTDDTLTLWLDAINRAVLGAERTSGLFSETDESDGGETGKGKTKGSSSDSKPLAEKTFNSLKKLGSKKDSGVKDHELSGASLDRKYLKFLGSRTQNVPVPTAQFRSYRRVLPSSTPNRKPEKLSSPDLQVTIAGSTFYGLNSSQSATDVLTTSQDMGDYRRTTERLRGNRNQRPEELQSLMTLEEFMLARQEEECQQRSNSNNYNNNTVGNANHNSHNNSNSPSCFTPLNNDHVHVQHHAIAESLNNIVQTNGMIYGCPRNVISEEATMSSPTEQAPPTPTRSDLVAASNRSFDGSESGSSRADSVKSKASHKSKPWEPSCLQKKKQPQPQQQQAPGPNNINNNYEPSHAYSPTPTIREFGSPGQVVNDNRIGYSTLDYGERLKPQARYRTMDCCNANVDFSQAGRRGMRSDGYSSSSSDLACQACTETAMQQHQHHQQRPRKEVGRNGSFNMADRRRPDYAHADDNWTLEVPRSDDNSRTIDDRRGSPMRIAGHQYHQPSTSIPASALHQEAMMTAFEQHLEQQLQYQQQQQQPPASPKKSKGLRNLFGKSSPKASSHDPSREPTQKKTLLGSPSLRRAFFRDKPRNRSTAQTPVDNDVAHGHYTGTSHAPAFYSNFSAMNFGGNTYDSSQIHHAQRYATDETGYAPQANPNHRYYIPAQWPSSASANVTSRMQNVDYPPTFEPETYTFSNPSLRRQRSTKNNEDYGTCQ